MIVVTAQAAGGKRPGALHRQLLRASTAPPPGDCPKLSHDGGNLFKLRLVQGRFPTFGASFEPAGDGRLTLWIGPREPIRLDGCLLAVVATSSRTHSATPVASACMQAASTTGCAWARPTRVSGCSARSSCSMAVLAMEAGASTPKAAS